MIETFKKFMADDNAWDMYVTGRAGTGKTTKLAKLITDLESYTVCAYTHKACDILRSTLGSRANISTLHSFLKKRPTINNNATSVKHIDSNQVQGPADRVHVMFIDEYSMIGEQDLMDIRELQDEDYDGVPGVKVVWIGDPHQLPPVGDMFTLKPYGDYQVTLTKIYRQAEDNPLMAPLNQLVSFIEGADPEPLITSDSFIRGQELTMHDHSGDSIILAYTNAKVQELNEVIQGRGIPIYGDILFSPTSKKHYLFTGGTITPSKIDLPFGGREMMLDSKFRTLEHLHTMEGVEYCVADDLDEEAYSLAYVFGHQDYLDMLKHYKQLAVESNKAIEAKHKGFKAAGWAKANHTTKLARARSKAWRDFLTFNECVICLDFSHAMTVHKSQGSTYDTVYLDTDDIAKAAARDYLLYLKLMYVGMSRASNKVVTN